MFVRLGRLWERHVTSHLDAIDAEAASADGQTGRLSPRTEAVVVIVTGALVLAGMAYGVLAGPVQRRMSAAILEGARDLSPELGADLARWDGLLPLAVWTVGAALLYGAVPGLVGRFVLGRSPRDLGLSLKGFRRHAPIYGLLFLPVLAAVLVVAGTPAFQQKYPFYRSPQGLSDFIVWEALYLLQFLALEFFFRGFLVHGTRRRLGSLAAFLPLIPYVMIHFSKPALETLGAVVAGSVLGLLSLRTGSVAGGVLIHGAVAVTMDIAALAHRGFPW